MKNIDLPKSLWSQFHCWSPNSELNLSKIHRSSSSIRLCHHLANQGGISSSVFVKVVFFTDNFISYWNPCIWLAESKFVSEKHWQNTWWNAPLISQKYHLFCCHSIEQSDWPNDSRADWTRTRIRERLSSEFRLRQWNCNHKLLVSISWSFDFNILRLLQYESLDYIQACKYVHVVHFSCACNIQSVLQ